MERDPVPTLLGAVGSGSLELLLQNLQHLLRDHPGRLPTKSLRHIEKHGYVMSISLLHP
jgi:hypothetical protein